MSAARLFPVSAVLSGIENLHTSENTENKHEWQENFKKIRNIA